MPKLVADLSDYQPSDVNFMQGLKDGGVSAVIIKLTEGTGWTSATAAEKIRNAVQVGLIVHCYHYARFFSAGQAVAEANHFCTVAKAYGIDQTSVMALDLEEGSEPAFAKTFLDQVLANGYPRIDLYTMASYIWAGKVNLGSFGYQLNAWIASYGASQPGVDNVGTWQFSSEYPIVGVKLDMSYDFSGYYTTEQGAAEPEKVTSGGYLDSVTFDGDRVSVSGWFGTDQAQNKPYHYVILTSDGHELARQQVDLVDRPDVHIAYPDIDGKCGFTAEFDYTKEMAGKKVTIYFRYTDDPAGNGNFADFTADHEFTQNLAYLDGKKSTVLTNQLQLTGWHAADTTLGLQHRFLILLADGQEIQRLKVDPVDRPDVAKAYPGVYGAAQAGFSGSFNYPSDLVGKKLQLVSRYSDDEHGEGHYVDYWFPEFAGPEMPAVDGTTETEVLVHSFTVNEIKDGMMRLKFK